VEATFSCHPAFVQRQPVQSRALRSAGYDAEKQDLELEFSSGQVYCYSSVPASVYVWLLRASNKGIFVTRQIVGRYPERSVAESSLTQATPAEALEQVLRDSLARLDG
jgi:KTSC domain